jgi:pteridine reductase
MSHESPLPLTGRVVLVTGGARRLGAEIVRTLHAAGAAVMIHYHHSATEAATLVRSLNAVRPLSAALASADLLDVGALSGLIEAVVRTFGRLDILVNNASSFYPTPIGSITVDAFDDLVGTNFRAPLFLSQAAAPELRRTEGLIVNLVDIHGTRPLKRHPVYSSAKAALVMLTQSLARELAPEVRVNGIAPGPVMWPEGVMDADLQARILDRTALKRTGSATDIARAVRFFATDAPYVTGQILAVDGGRSVGGY